MNIKAVLFDLDDTLYGEFEHCDRLGYAACGRYGETHLNIPAQTLMDAMQAAKKELYARLPDQPEIHDRALVAQLGLERLGINPLPHAEALFEVYWNTVLDAMVLREGADTLLRQLTQAGIPVGVCTNMTAAIQMRKLCRLGLADHCGALITSEEAGRDKPQPEIFELALRKLGTRAEETLMVGDNFHHDATGALGIGMQALWLNFKDKPLPASEKTYLTASSFPDAAAQILNLCGLCNE